VSLLNPLRQVFNIDGDPLSELLGNKLTFERILALQIDSGNKKGKRFPQPSRSKRFLVPQYKKEFNF
jgi:hypothetical protein